ncbi:DUF2164 domain-containing protein [Candidatus Endomicrobiellum devescovinae]|jgi:uncharacterized protein (DUF2164 family)|uniref:DUF2164 domain-containing protein n=1 Tax=Candidatus Endomicrobiellum devescovinae TaxID=3242322 RepID=UPI00281C0D29|nr:DUF2164 domain-containing protein [Endomicrobium sp.]
MKKHYNKIDLTKEQKLQIAAKLKKYLRENYYTDIGDLKAELFIDFISDTIAPFYYNKGLADSITLMKDRIEDLYSLMKEEK